MENRTRQTEIRETKKESHLAQTVASLLFGTVELLLLFRLVFKLLGANPENPIVQGVYEISQYIVGLFEGIFSDISMFAIGNTAVFEPASAIAMVTVAFVAWGVLKLLKPRQSQRYEKNQYEDPK
ncbi:YggT family protein [Proteiniclasticum ruminis]|uniref:YGGT family protein n=1 Tax=Proteiniclasticum ruminis TaxID=398199 RepID=A0A1I5DEE7_9CLOT|nr:YggT family protein [Proteiniclasticum ruminis]SFN97634.1 YGGT family protein [Proteiniclasticum ruminis]